MTAAAAAIVEKPLASQHDGFGRFSRFQPVFVRLRLHYYHPPHHLGMLCAAVLRTKNMIFARARRLEPDAGISPGHDILFYSKSWNQKTVDDVLRCHRHCDGAIDRHVQLIDFALALGVLKFPHPLFTDHLHLNRVRRSSFESKIRQRTPGKESERKEDRPDGPAALHPKRAGTWIGAIG